MTSVTTAINNLKKVVQGIRNETAWIPETLFIERTGYSKKTLAAMRKDGRINSSDWRATQSGRKLQYHVSVIDKLFNKYQ